MVGLPGWGLAFQLAQPTLGVWPGGNWLPGWLQGQVLCGLRGGPRDGWGLLMFSVTELVRIALWGERGTLSAAFG